jgi:hypothetical protein
MSNESKPPQYITFLIAGIMLFVIGLIFHFMIIVSVIFIILSVISILKNKGIINKEQMKWIDSIETALIKEKKSKKVMHFKNISGLSLSEGTLITLLKYDYGIIIEDSRKQYKIDISYKNIINIMCDTYSETETKNKSVLGRAVVGGVLTGGVGAIVGGMSGIGSKQKTKKVPIVRIDYVVKGVKDTILLEDSIELGTSAFIDSIRKKIK